MSASIYQWPGAPERLWRPIAEAIRPGVLQSAPSPEVARVIEARIRDIFERCVPPAFEIPTPLTPEVVSDLIHTLAGGFVAEIAQVVTEAEVLKLDYDQAD